MNISDGKKIIPTKIIVLETILERAVLRSMVEMVTRLVTKDFDEEVKIQLDDITGQENLYPKPTEITKILDEFDKVR